MTVTTRPPSHGAAPGRGRLARAVLGSEGEPRWSRPALWGVLGLAFVLYAWALSGMANEYYSAAILSGTKSWKAFFFGALDFGSFITVDKPPFALWVMGLSARILGFGTWSMLLPQAVAGVVTVALVHSAVRRSLPLVRPGAAHAAALLAAVVMTLTPITVAINRDNNPDTILVLLLVAAAWFALEAIRRGGPRPLLMCALLVGLGFNTKMLQAYLVLPAFALAYLTCAAAPFPRRLGHLLGAGVVLVASSAWWMVIVDLWPASSRPYVGGSTDNSVWDLVIGYNGLGRIFGQGFGGGGRGGGASFGGESGAGRLFNDTMAGQISWLLPFCALALLLAAATWRTLGTRAVPGEDRSSVSALGERAGPRVSRAAWLVWGGWLAVHHVVFSFSSGTFHPYYSTAMAPAVAAVTGMGAVLMWRAYRRSPWWWVLPLAVAATGAWSFVVLRRTPEFVPWLAWAVAAACVTAVAGLVVARLGRGKAARVAAGSEGAAGARVAAVAVVAALLTGLAGPAAYAVTPLRSQINGTNPTAGPASGAGFGAGSGAMRGGPGAPGGRRAMQAPPGQTGQARGGPGGGVSSALIAYLEQNQGTATWLVAVGSARQAAPIILRTGEPVIAMGGFTGSDPAMTVEGLKELVASGRLKYVMADDARGGPGGGDSEVTDWVRATCAAVDGQDGLYLCAP
ncbi:glycosyltransferase family 39 protein [Nonomuraea dietziae]|uniref:glycosyltransferase family 39 protein n=1 Tax=Nonomuraea dietziae TaxID=65515 RepID=UPI0033EFD679